MNIGPNSSTERPRKTKIGTGIAHVTRDSDTTFKVKRARSPGRFTHRGLNISGSCSDERGNVSGMGNYCYVAVCSAALGTPEGGEGRGHIVAAARLQLVSLALTTTTHFTAPAASSARRRLLDALSKSLIHNHQHHYHTDNHSLFFSTTSSILQ